MDFRSDPRQEPYRRGVPSPTVDVVVLSWNRIDMTVDAIESALAQEGVDLTVTVLDQGSDADQLERLRAHLAGRDRVVLVEVPENLGVPGGRNLAASYGEAEFIFNLDNDAVLDDDTSVARAVGHLVDHPEVGIAGLRILNDTTGEDDPLSWTYPAELRARSHETLRMAKFVGCAHVMRRAVFEAVGRFDDALFFGGEEMDLAFRVIDAGHAIDYLGDVRVRHRVDPEKRVEWSDDRFYYFVRNGYYVFEKYLPSRTGVSLRTLGRVVQGARNGFLRQTIRGLRDGRRMLRQMSRSERDAAAISDAARDYVTEHQFAHEGSLASRLRQSLTRR